MGQSYGAVKLQSTKLSPIEKDILQLAASGWTSMEIAQSRRVSAATVRSQLSRIASKLNARSTTHSVAVAMHYKLIDFQPSLD